MTRVRISLGGAVACRATLHLPLSAISVWGQIRDFSRYARTDFFHAQIEMDQPIPSAGVNLIIHHRFALFRVKRIGRIVWWREGVGYSFSDLSCRGMKMGFPHILSYRIQAIADRKCRLNISVRGRWTNWLPRWMAWLWMHWVFGHIVQNVERMMLVYQLWRKRG